MEIKTIGDILAVPVPSTTNKAKMMGDILRVEFVRNDGSTWDYNWGNFKGCQIIGLASEVVKDEAKCVEITPLTKGHPAGNYAKEVGYPNYLDVMSSFQTAIESFQSWMIKHEVYLVNPYGDEPKHLDYKYEKFKGEFHFKSERDKNTYADKWEQWQEAQQHVGEYLLVREVK